MPTRPRSPEAKREGKIKLPEHDWDDDPPAFCFRYARPGFRIADLSPEGKTMLLDKLEMLTEFTWLRLKMMGRRDGAEKISQTSLRVPLPDCLPRNDAVVSIRVEKDGMFRLLGFRSTRILHVLWFDPAGRCYEH